MGSVDIRSLLAAGSGEGDVPDLPRPLAVTALPALCARTAAPLEVKVPDDLATAEEAPEPTQAERDLDRLLEGFGRPVDGGADRLRGERDELAARLAAARAEAAALAASVEERVRRAAEGGRAEGRRARDEELSLIHI